MPEISQWITLETLSTPQGAALVLWMVVQVSKDLFDTWWQRITGKPPRTMAYALAWAYIIVFGSMYFDHRLTAATAFTGIFNGLVAIVLAGLPSWVGKGQKPDAAKLGVLVETIPPAFAAVSEDPQKPVQEADNTKVRA